MKNFLLATFAVIVIVFITFYGFDALYVRIVNILGNVNNYLAQLMVEASANKWAGLTMVGGSFLYGVLHAIGPGHGKFVLTSYSLATNPKFRRLVFLGLTISLLQGLTAVIIGSVALYLFSSTASVVFKLNDHLGIVSGLMIGSLATFWLIRSVIRFVRIWRLAKQEPSSLSDKTKQEDQTTAAPTSNQKEQSCSTKQEQSTPQTKSCCSHDKFYHEYKHSSDSSNHKHAHEHTSECCNFNHQHSHEHTVKCCNHQHSYEHSEVSCNHHKHSQMQTKQCYSYNNSPHKHLHEHTDYEHEHAKHCCHRHGDEHEQHTNCDCKNHLDWEQFNQLDSNKERMMMALSIILRPCTGALAVLIFAYVTDLWWWGVLSTMVMALGTGIGLIFTVQLVNFIKKFGFDRFSKKRGLLRSLFIQAVIVAISLALLAVAINTAYQGYTGQGGNKILSGNSQTRPLLKQNNKPLTPGQPITLPQPKED